MYSNEVEDPLATGHTLVEWVCFQCGYRIANEQMAVIMREQLEEQQDREFRAAHPEEEQADITRSLKDAPRRVAPFVRQQYLEENRAQISADFAELGVQPTLKKWNISPSTWPRLKKRWGLPDVSRRRRVDKPHIVKNPDTGLSHYEVTPEPEPSPAPGLAAMLRLTFRHATLGKLLDDMTEDQWTAVSHALAILAAHKIIGIELVNPESK